MILSFNYAKLNNIFVLFTYYAYQLSHNYAYKHILQLFSSNRIQTLTVIKQKNAVQVDGFECGDLAIAKAIDILSNKDPTKITYANPIILRAHTAKILFTQKISRYPTQNNKQFTKQSKFCIPIVCLCGYCDFGTKMVHCRNCKRTFHAECLGVSNKLIEYCQVCKK